MSQALDEEREARRAVDRCTRELVAAVRAWSVDGGMVRSQTRDLERAIRSALHALDVAQDLLREKETAPR